MISKSISTSTKLSKVSDFAALLFTWIQPHCDDGGNMDADPIVVRGLVVPMRKQTVEEVAVALKELEGVGLISPYEVNGTQYLHVEQFEKHQTLRGDRPDFRYPDNPMATIGKPSGNQRSTNVKPNRTEQNGTERNRTGMRDKPQVSFDEFWNAYPRKVGKPAASRAYARHHVTPELQKKMLEAIERHKKSKQWMKDGGQFIPYPATWLNQERWNDDIEAGKQKVGGGKFENVKSIKV
jgi:hypothetical protein